MEKETFDFSAAKVGDLVSNPTFGKGIIHSIGKDTRPLIVTFNNRDSYFTFDGRINIGYPQSLYHGHVDFKIETVEPCPYEVGEWIAVRNHKSHAWELAEFEHTKNTGNVRASGIIWEFHTPLSSFNQKEV